MLLAAISMTGLLASCGSTGSNQDAFVSLQGIRTEYRMSNGQYVACDNLLNTGSANTQIAVLLRAQGTINTVQVGLRGNTDSQYDGNYNATIAPGYVNGSYRILFNATPEGGLLPNSIVVSPTQTKVKLVTPLDAPAGSFRVDMTVNTNAGSFNISTSSLGTSGNIPVYSTCRVDQVTNEDV